MQTYAADFRGRSFREKLGLKTSDAKMARESLQASRKSKLLDVYASPRRPTRAIRPPLVRAACVWLGRVRRGVRRARGAARGDRHGASARARPAARFDDAPRGRRVERRASSSGARADLDAAFAAAEAAERCPLLPPRSRRSWGPVYLAAERRSRDAVPRLPRPRSIAPRRSQARAPCPVPPGHRRGPPCAPSSTSCARDAEQRPRAPCGRQRRDRGRHVPRGDDGGLPLPTREGPARGSDRPRHRLVEPAELGASGRDGLERGRAPPLARSPRHRRADRERRAPQRRVRGILRLDAGAFVGAVAKAKKLSEEAACHYLQLLGLLEPTGAGRSRPGTAGNLHKENLRAHPKKLVVAASASAPDERSSPGAGRGKKNLPGTEGWKKALTTRRVEGGALVVPAAHVAAAAALEIGPTPGSGSKRATSRSWKRSEMAKKTKRPRPAAAGGDHLGRGVALLRQWDDAPATAGLALLRAPSSRP